MQTSTLGGDGIRSSHRAQRAETQRLRQFLERPTAAPPKADTRSWLRPSVRTTLRVWTACLTSLLLAGGAIADFSPIQPSSELVLDGVDGLIDQLYGIENVERMDDFNASSDDQTWVILGVGTASARARFAGLDHEFGVLPGESGGAPFVFLLSASQSGVLNDPGVSFDVATTGETFRLGLNTVSGSPPAVVDAWSSRIADNADGGDHMVAWRIVSSNSEFPSNPVGSFVVGWEDLEISSPLDPNEPDYNDLVVEISFVAPAICGDGIVTPDEQCDDGGLVDGDCCSSTCQIEAAGTLCRAGAGACDAAEVCDGVNPVCPVDASLPDGSSCADSDLCNGDEICSAGTCAPGPPLACDDGNACTADSCDSLLGCQNPALPDGVACADGDLCNGAEVCASGVCSAGPPLDCADGNTCTIDGCNPLIGCEFAPRPDGFACADADLCNGAEACLGAVCTPGAPVTCNDANFCTADSCDPSVGCVFAPVADGISCSDGEVCNGGEACVAGTCTPGTPMADGSACGDLDLCNGVELCQGQVCQSGTPLGDGAACGDADVCNGDELCAAGVCGQGTPVDCDDADDCTADTCDAAGGCSHALIPDCGNPTAAVVPLLDCVQDNPDGTLTAHFGYRNDNPVPITIPVGPNNSFNPAPADIGQDTLFDPDRHPFYPNSALSVIFDGSPLTWTLQGPDSVAYSSTASSNSLRCPPDGADFSEATICYGLRVGGDRKARAPKIQGVGIGDSVESKIFDVKKANTVCLPVETLIDGKLSVVADPTTWQLARKIRQSKKAGPQPRFERSDPANKNIELDDIFGSHKVDLLRQDSLMIPSIRCNPELQTCPGLPGAVDITGLPAEAAKCYRVKPSAGEPKLVRIPIVGTDEFQTRVYGVGKASMFCTPASVDGSEPGALTSQEGTLCYKLALRTLYCEAGSPPEFSLEHCQPIGQCGEGQCVVLPKKFLHRWRSDLKLNNHFFPETLATFSQKHFCVPATRAATP